MTTPAAPTIRPAIEADWPGIWAVFEPIVRAGESYPIDRDASEKAVRAYWHAADKMLFVAADKAGTILGSYYLKPNSTGPAAHVCNAGYIVHAEWRGRGVATALCEHSMREARRQGYRAMQYNLVIATNSRAVRLWQHLGFGIVGTLPGAFHHHALGYVDAYVMYRSLIDAD